jgi:membrane-associated phospholipid phosphatase
MRKIGAALVLGALLSAHAGAQGGPDLANDDSRFLLPAGAVNLDGNLGIAPCSDEAALGRAPEGAEAESPPGIGTIALKDTIATLGAPLHWKGENWLVFGGIAAGVAAVGFAFDVPMRDKTQAHQTSTLDELTKVVEPFGAEYSWAVIGAYGIAGFVFRDPEAKDIFFDSAIASILASGIITPTLKFVIGRERPNESPSSTSFHPFSGSDNSFPSGHTTQAFAVASVISAHSDQVWVSVTAYTIAGLVGFARIYHNAHWTSDVTAGAIIGTFVGRGVVALNKKLRSGEGRVRVAFAPFITGRERGASVLIAF